jgi:hypothetical protein
MILSKPCARRRLPDGALAPGCLGTVTKTEPARFAVASFCSRACHAQHRLACGDHPFQKRTPAEILRNARKAGQTRGAQAQRRKRLAVAARLGALLPAAWTVRFGAQEVARITALLVRAYLEGKEDGYQAGHTAVWREAIRRGKATAA